MRIIFNVLPDPTDVVLAGLQPVIGDVMPPDNPFPVDWTPWNTAVQGEIPLANMPPLTLPRMLVNWMPYFPVPDKIGLIATQGGLVAMEPLGPVKVQPLIDPVQIWLARDLPLDTTGTLYTTDQIMPSYAEPVFDRLLSGEVPFASLPLITSPRTEVLTSGLLKNGTAPVLPPDFGQKIYENQFSYPIFTLNGITVDGTGTPVGGVRVIVYQSGWRYVQTGEKIIAEAVSDGSGNFSFLVRNIDYQLVGYKVGSPDLGGVTRQDVVPTAASTLIYMRDPTAPDSGGGGNTYSRSRVVNR